MKRNTAVALKTTPTAVCILSRVQKGWEGLSASGAEVDVVRLLGRVAAILELMQPKIDKLHP